MENKKSDFSEWYNEIIDAAKLSDKRYIIKGMNIWLPYGLKIMRSIDNLLREYSEASGIEEVSFPVLISREQLEVEFEHVKGFENEIYWVTRGGTTPLDIDLALRPTSEAAMYTMLPLWIRSHTDLPFRIYQIVSVYRYETKHTRSFIRVREIHFYEAHTAHRDFQDAERQMEDYVKIMDKISDDLCINFAMDIRPDWDKFPGAMYSVAFDTPMPGSRSLQIGTIHEYGENFAKNYGIKYLDDQGEMKYVSQTTFGLSERLMAAIIGIHGDDKGLVLPYKLAPIHVIIVPISGEDYGKIIEYSNGVLSELSGMGVRAKIDTRDYTPGYKFNDWEMRGVPIRIEIGKREVKDNTLTISMRTRKNKIKAELGDLKNIYDYLKEVNIDIRKRANEFYDSNTTFIGNMDKIGEEKMVRAYWCGDKKCSDTIELRSEKTALGIARNDSSSGPCIVCGKTGKLSVFSRTY
jgi:prolyl-tRNA synthetase